MSYEKQVFVNLETVIDARVLEHVEDGIIACELAVELLKSLTDGLSTDANEYTDMKIAELLDTSQETIETLNSLSKALEDNSDVIEVLQNAIGSKQPTIIGGATTITDADLTTLRVLVSNISGKVAVSEITPTELSYLSGITSNIQTQLTNLGKLVADGKTLIATSISNYVSAISSDTFEQLNTKMNSAFTSRYDAGYGAGNTAGYNSGYNAGNTAGITTGYNNRKAEYPNYKIREATVNYASTTGAENITYLFISLAEAGDIYVNTVLFIEYNGSIITFDFKNYNTSTRLYGVTIVTGLTLYMSTKGDYNSYYIKNTSDFLNFTLKVTLLTWDASRTAISVTAPNSLKPDDI